MLNSLEWPLLFLGAASAHGALRYYEGFDPPAAEDGLQYHGGFAANPDPAAGKANRYFRVRRSL